MHRRAVDETHSLPRPLCQLMLPRAHLLLAFAYLCAALVRSEEEERLPGWRGEQLRGQERTPPATLGERLNAEDVARGTWSELLSCAMHNRCAAGVPADRRPCSWRPRAMVVHNFSACSSARPRSAVLCRLTPRPFPRNAVSADEAEQVVRASHGQR